VQYPALQNGARRLNLFLRVPGLVRNLFPHREWKLKTREKLLYLSFDDGPHPAITPWTMDVLDQFQAKATFFCVGDNVRKFPEVYAQITERGHRCGNHTMNHLKGWKTPTDRYLENVAEAAHWINSDLFRPPYGRMTRNQEQQLKDRYRIIMWTLLSADYQPNLNQKRALEFLKRNTAPGSIVVFHDSEKARNNLEFLLPRYLEFAHQAGYIFAAL
jgi:peptidoglycan/xylan/chitin deacetylase (PgdA/CDA1 family)